MDLSRGAIGILGGTFDPVHYGHLAAAQEAAAVLGLDRVLFLPANDPPHKREESVTAAAQRLAMVKLAIADNPLFDLCEIELYRSGPSYTVDTLRSLRSTLPNTELYFIVGMDSLTELPGWHDPIGILDLAHVIAVHRPGWNTVDVRDLVAKIPTAASRVQVIPMPGLDLSATDLRSRIHDGRPVRYLIPDPVIGYIREHGLYRS
jgi:nicotinate-nucleotide adenylyltransferase